MIKIKVNDIIWKEIFYDIEEGCTKFLEYVLKNKALSLIENNGTLEDIKMYNEVFVKTDETSGNENSGTVFNFNMTKDS